MDVSGIVPTPVRRDHAQLDRERTDRQRRLPGFDQDAVAAARVLVIGAGGLGCPVVQALAAAGGGICILWILIRWSCRIFSVSRFWGV